MRRNVLGHHGAGADDAAFSDGHAAQHGDIAAEPAVRTDDDRPAVFVVVRRAVRRLAHVAVLPAQRMHRRQQGHIRPEQHIVADGDWRAVQHGEVEVREHAVAHRGVHAIVEEHRSQDVQVLAMVGEQVVQHGGPGLMIAARQRVEPGAQVASAFAQCRQLRVGRVVEFSIQHLLALRAAGRAQLDGRHLVGGRLRSAVQVMGCVVHRGLS